MTVLTQAKEKAARQCWRTPDDFFAAINAEFAFDVDVAASVDNARCQVFISEQFDALAETTSWFDFQGVHETPWEPTHIDVRLRNAYCNPGFGNVLPWVQKAHTETQRVPNSVAVVMAHGGLASDWFRFAAANASEIRLLSPRVQYMAPPGVKQSSNSRDCVAMVFRHGPVRGAHIWSWRWTR